MQISAMMLNNQPKLTYFSYDLYKIHPKYPITKHTNEKFDIS